MSHLRDKLLALPKMKSVPLYIKEWDETIYIKRLTTKEMDATLIKDLPARLISFIVDVNDKPLFNLTDIELVNNMDSVVATKIMEKFNQFHDKNYVNREDVEELKKS